MKNPENNTSFEQFGLKKTVLQAIKDAGFTKPSSIQEEVIPHILNGSDIVAQAETGSGKTAAFCLPALHLMDKSDNIGLLVITPTRELAQQVSGEVSRFGKNSGVTSMAVYGGQPAYIQIKKLRQGVQALVATPGRLLDLLKSKHLPRLQPSVVVLDEADEMMDMGFLEDIQAIFSFLPEERQTLFFSATMPKPIQKLAKKTLQDPVFVNTIPPESSHQDIEQIYYPVKEKEREAALLRLIDSHYPYKSLIFCRTKKEVDTLSASLNKLGYPARCLHGDMEQAQRQRAIHAFRMGDSKILVATDVAGRGLDITDISHVFNYHMPFSAESYTHRIGRTGRAGKKGVAISLISPTEFRKIRHILKTDRKNIPLTPVPSLREMKKLQQKNLMNKIKSEATHLDSEKILKTLETEMDLTQIGINLISMLLNKQKISGPEHVGLSVEELLKSDFPRKKGRQNNRFKPKERFKPKGGSPRHRKRKNAMR